MLSDYISSGNYFVFYLPDATPTTIIRWFVEDLLMVVSSTLKINDKTGHVGVTVNLYFFTYPVPADFNATHRDIH